MELTPQEIELTDRYFRNELTEKELSDFRNRISADRAFADEINAYFQTFDAVTAIGRQDLLNELKSVKQELESADGFDEYTPGKTKGKNGSGSTGGILAIIIFAIITALIAWLYYSGNIPEEKNYEGEFSSYKTDTVYHYQITRDTVISNNKNELKKTYRADTVYIR